jgi:hypothetical protein
MIGCFPDPYPDELLYSVFARLNDRMQYPSRKGMLRDIFGNEHANAPVYLPSHLEYLTKVLPPAHRYTVDRLIDDHTLAPYYALFLPPERYVQLRADMRGDGGQNIHFRAGLGKVPGVERFRFCPLCIEDDRWQFGECYWHRVHQAPGVEVCPIHGLYLQQSELRIWNRKAKDAFISAEVVLGQVLPGPEMPVLPPDEPLLQVAHDVMWLLNQRHLSPDPDTLQRRYLNVLYERQLADSAYRVITAKFLTAFKAYYPPTLLNRLNCELNEDRGVSWPLRLLRPACGVRYPVCHLLIMRFLGYTAAEFFKLSAERKPFGRGPWPCLNPASDHYRQFRIKECDVVFNPNLNNVVGTFVCTKCGFIYTRLGPETSPEEQFQMRAIKTFGHVWDATLQKLWADPSINLKMLRQQLGISARTLHQCAIRLELPYPKPGLNNSYHRKPKLPSRREEILPATRESYRAAFLAAKEKHPDAGITALKEKIPDVCLWLSRHDHAWFEANKPILKYNRREKPTTNYADWHSRDTEFVVKVKPTAWRLKNMPERPVRVTKTMLAREIGIRHSMYLPKLPLTSQALTEAVDTRDEYDTRRVWWAVDYYRQEKIKPKRWQLIRRAGVHKGASRPLVKEAIDTALKMLSAEIGT